MRQSFFVKWIIKYPIFHCYLISFLSEAVEANRCYSFEKWLMKHKWVTLMTMQLDIYHENYQYFYPSEPFEKNHITMRHPVKVGLVFSISNFFVTKMPLANNWKRKKIPSCSYLALSTWLIIFHTLPYWLR